MNPQGLQFPLGFQQGQQQQNLNAGSQPSIVSAASGQIGMPALNESNNMGSQLQNAAQMVQSIRGNIAALQRQWAVIQGQPEGPTKTNAQQHLASQLKRLQMMEQSAIQSMGAHIPPGAQLSQQQQQPGQMGMQPQQQQQNVMMQGLNPAQLAQMQSQQGINGLGMDPNFAASQQNDLNQFQQQQQQQQQSQQSSPFGQPGIQSQQMQTPQAQPQQPGFNPAQISAPSPSAQLAGSAAGMGGAAGGAKRDFVGTVRNFMQQRGTPFPPQLSLSFVGPASSNLPGDTKTIELQALFAAVIHSGGSQRAAQIPGFWAVIASRLGLKVGPPDGTQSAPDAVPSPGEVPDRLSAFYRDRLSAFEQFWMSRMPQRQPSGQSGAAGSPAASGANANPTDPNLQAAQSQSQSQSQPQPQQIPPQPGQQPPTPQQQQQAQSQQQPQQQPQQGAQPSANRPGAPGQITPANLPANLHQQMLQLQHLVATGRITSQQARERFVAMQQATRQMMVKQQQQQQQQTQPSSSNEASQGPQQQQQQQQPSQQQQQPLPSGMPNGPQGFPGMPPMAQSQPSPASAQRATPGQASPAPNQGLPGSMPGAAPGLFSDPAAMLAQQPQPQFQPQPQPGPDGVPAWPTQPSTGMPPSPIKSQAPNGAVPKTPTTSVKPEPKQSKKKRKKTDGSLSTPLPPGAGVDVKPPMPQLGDQAGGAGAMGQPPIGAPLAPPTALAPQPEKQVIPGTSQPVGPPAPPQKHKIEYLPIRRDVQTHGGWDLSLVESQYAPAMATRGRPRTLRELGLVDVQGLIMSLRSRLDFEVSYALNTLLILSAGVGTAPNFQFGLAACEDLLEELLDLLEETSFQSKPDDDDDANPGLDSLLQLHSTRRPTKRLRRERGLDALPTYRDWIAAAAEEEAELKIWRRRKAARSRSTAGSVLNGGSEVDSLAGSASAVSSHDSLDATTTISTNGIELEQERSIEQRAVTALTILTILKNFSTMPENMFFFNSTPKLLQVLARLCQSDAERVRATQNGEDEEEEDDDANGGDKADGTADGQDTVFTTMEALRVRKEVLVIVSNLAGEALALRTQKAETVRTLFELLASFILEAGAVEEMDRAAEIAELAASLPPGAPAPPVIRRIPYHADLALDALSKLALPDDNREVLGNLVDGLDLERLVSDMVKMLPMTESDFKVLNTEHRLGYCERLSMCLYNLAFLSPPSVKLRLRRIPGLSGVVLRIVKKLSRATPDFSRNPFSVLCRRLVEALRLISDGNDMFGAPALLGFGFSDGASGGAAAAAAGSVGRKQIGLLLNDEEGVVEILGTNELDGVLGDELFALIASG